MLYMLFFLLFSLLLQGLVVSFLVLELSDVGFDLVLDQFGEAGVDIELTHHPIGNSMGRIPRNIEVKTGRTPFLFHGYRVLNCNIDHISGTLLPLGTNNLFFRRSCYKCLLLLLVLKIIVYRSCCSFRCFDILLGKLRVIIRAA